MAVPPPQMRLKQEPVVILSWRFVEERSQAVPLMGQSPGSRLAQISSLRIDHISSLFQPIVEDLEPPSCFRLRKHFSRMDNVEQPASRQPGTEQLPQFNT